MANPRSKAFFIAGTDTGVGKTHVAAAILHQANKQNLRSLGLKPVAAGGITVDGKVQNEDALLLQQHASIELSYQEVCPVTLSDPVSPHIAAENEKRQLNVERIAGFCRGALMKPHDIAVVEGAGGWRVPISPRATMADIARTLNLPVILVVGLRLGCLNHTFLTVEAIMRDGLTIAGWVTTCLDPNMLEIEKNIETLDKRLSFPCLGHIPYLSNVTAESLSDYIDISKLSQSSEA